MVYDRDLTPHRKEAPLSFFSPHTLKSSFLLTLSFFIIFSFTAFMSMKGGVRISFVLLLLLGVVTWNPFLGGLLVEARVRRNDDKQEEDQGGGGGGEVQNDSQPNILMAGVKDESCRYQPRRFANLHVDHFPWFRYNMWYELTEGQQMQAHVGLDFDEQSWNEPGSAAIEFKSYWSPEMTSEERAAIRRLGFAGGQYTDKDSGDEEDIVTDESGCWDMAGIVWDCFVNHYSGHSWTQLKHEGVRDYFVTLGWTEDIWNKRFDDVEPDIWRSSWNELTPEQKFAGENLCFIPQTWDMNPMNMVDWQEYSPHQHPNHGRYEEEEKQQQQELGGLEPLQNDDEWHSDDEWDEEEDKWGDDDEWDMDDEEDDEEDDEDDDEDDDEEEHDDEEHDEDLIQVV